MNDTKLFLLLLGFILLFAVFVNAQTSFVINPNKINTIIICPNFENCEFTTKIFSNQNFVNCQANIFNCEILSDNTIIISKTILSFAD